MITVYQGEENSTTLKDLSEMLPCFSVYNSNSSWATSDCNGEAIINAYVPNLVLMESYLLNHF